MWPVALALGAICGLGTFVVVREFVPGRPGLQAALDRLSGDDRRPDTLPDDEDTDLTQRVGAWARRTLPVSVVSTAGPSPADLDLIGKSRSTHDGEKALGAVIALVAVPTLGVGAGLLGIGLPFSMPVGLGVLLAVGAWFLPDLDARSKAKRARQTFVRAVSTYLELLAIERISGAGATQSAFAAAAVARSWPFRRVSESLERGRWDGKPPWIALRELGREVGVTELGDVADIMEQAGTEGSAVHDQLQSRAAAMRDAQLDVEQQLAHDATVRMTIPGTLTVLVYFVMLIFPIGLTMFATSAGG